MFDSVRDTDLNRFIEEQNVNFDSEQFIDFLNTCNYEKRRPTAIITGTVLIISGFISIIIAAVIFFYILITTESIGSIIGSVILYFGFFTIGFLNRYIIWTGREYFKMKGISILKKNLGKTVLYLREFASDDAIKSFHHLLVTDESRIKSAFSKYAPIIALAKDGQESATGGFRISAPQEEVGWKHTVYGLLRISRFIVIRASTGTNLEWELKLCRKVVPPEKILIHIYGKKKSDVIALIEYLNNLKLFRSPINHYNIPHTFVAFDNQWTPFNPSIMLFKHDFRYNLRDFLKKQDWS